MDNCSSGYIANIVEYIHNGQVEFVGGDICDYQSVENAMDGIDVVFHLGASVGRQRSIDNPQLDLSND
jgi:nucleoside-diphosphate-sugar epimerase